MSVIVNNECLISMKIRNLKTIERKSIIDYFITLSKNYISILTSKPIDNTL